MTDALTLTLEQKYVVERIKRELPKLTREQLEDSLIKAIEQKYHLHNTYNKLMKQELGIIC